jgi:hypothetical protein
LDFCALKPSVTTSHLFYGRGSGIILPLITAVNLGCTESEISGCLAQLVERRLYTA